MASGLSVVVKLPLSDWIVPNDRPWVQRVTICIYTKAFARRAALVVFFNIIGIARIGDATALIFVLPSLGAVWV